MNVLLIGGRGFVGKHLRNYYEGCDCSVHSVSSKEVRENTSKVINLIIKYEISNIIFLSAISTVSESNYNFEENYSTGILALTTMLNALCENSYKGRFLYISSSEVYGFPLPKSKISECYPTNPQSHYAVNKVACENICKFYSINRNLDIVIARPFTHVGYGQSNKFALARFASELSGLKAKNLSSKNSQRMLKLHVGNLKSYRDITDVRDVCRAYNVLLRHAKNGETYNVCSGKTYSMASLLTQMMELMDMQNQVEVCSSRDRGMEQLITLGDNAKLSKLGWVQNYEIRDSIAEIVKFTMLK